MAVSRKLLGDAILAPLPALENYVYVIHDSFFASAAVSNRC